MIISRELATGANPGFLTTSDLHFNEKGEIRQKQEKNQTSFSGVLFDAVNQTDDLLNKTDDIEEQMVLNPDKVDIHAVMIASEKARLSLSFLKSITEKALRAYNDIMMLR
jgi:flagellar hook-basal body complex protein FliE